MSGDGLDDVPRRWVRPEATPLGERFPALRQVPDQSAEFVAAVASKEFSTRAGTMLRRANIENCGDLARVTEEELSDVRHVGRVAVGEVLGLLAGFERELVDYTKRPSARDEREAPPQATWAMEAALKQLRDEGNPILPIQSDLDVLTQWSIFAGGDGTLGGLVDAVAEPGALPEDVRAAGGSVRQFKVAVEHLSYHYVLDRWAYSLSQRERDVLVHRIVRVDRTLDAIGATHGVTRERIRQIERELRSFLGQRLAEEDWRPVRWAVHRLRGLVGTWARLDDVPDLDPTRVADGLVMVLAGLCVAGDGEAVRRRGQALPRLDDLAYLEPEGEVLDLDEARLRLTEVGVLAEHVEHTLRHLGLRQVEGTWVRWSRSRVDQSVAILAVAGEPMTADELTEKTGSASVRSLRQRLHSDPRVQRVNRAEVGLRSWGLPEYTSVAELMLSVIADAGGLMSVAELTEHLERVYQVRTGTVTAYTVAPVFVVSGGTIRARGRSDPYEVDDDPTDVLGLTVLDDDRFSYDVRVDREVLRGSGRPAPEALAGLLSLQPGRSLLFTTQDVERATTGTVVVSWSRTSHVGPYFGSLRAQALHDGAQDGDVLRLTFDRIQMSVRHALLT